jgi:hypothetical protein
MGRPPKFSAATASQVSSFSFSWAAERTRIGLQLQQQQQHVSTRTSVRHGEEPKHGDLEEFRVGLDAQVVSVGGCCISFHSLRRAAEVIMQEGRKERREKRPWLKKAGGSEGDSDL